MQSLFELKTELPFDMSVFDGMKKAADNLLRSAPNGQYTQAVILLSKNLNQYAVVIENALSEKGEDKAALLERLQNADDTEISYALCMWKEDGCIDIPSYSFREKLLALNSMNADSLMFVMTNSGISVIKLGTSMKCNNPDRH